MRPLLLFWVLALLGLSACNKPLDALNQAVSAQDVLAIWGRYGKLTEGYTDHDQAFTEELLRKTRDLIPVSPPMEAALLQGELNKHLAKRPVHYNFILVPDLSMRISREHYLRNFEQDPKIIDMLLDLFLKKVQRKYFGHKDRIVLRPCDLDQVRAFEEFAPSLDINMEGLPAQEQRQFIANLPQKKAVFMQAVEAMYQRVAQEGHRGADIWKFFDEDLDESLLRRSTDSDSIRNVVVVITDGYMEAGKYGKAYCDGNRCEYLSSNLIQAFRQSVLKSGMKWERLMEKEGYGITPIRNPKRLQGVEVINLEFYDRFPKKQPSDYLIVSAFWEKWYREMGLRAMVDKSKESPDDTMRKVAQFLEH